MNYNLQPGHPLALEWLLPYTPDLDIDEETAILQVSNGDLVAYDITVASGMLKISRHTADLITVTAYILHTSKLAVGTEYLYSLHVPDVSGNILLEDDGTITVVVHNPDGPMDVPEVTGQQPWNRVFASEEKVDNAIADARIAICTGCPFLVDDVCTECGCYMPIKAYIDNATCPIGNWGAV